LPEFERDDGAGDHAKGEADRGDSLSEPEDLTFTGAVSPRQRVWALTSSKLWAGQTYAATDGDEHRRIP
jgi:hypothetical protein